MELCLNNFECTLVAIAYTIGIIVLMSKCMPTRRVVVSVGGEMGRDGNNY